MKFLWKTHTPKKEYLNFTSKYLATTKDHRTVVVSSGILLTNWGKSFIAWSPLPEPFRKVRIVIKKKSLRKKIEQITPKEENYGTSI